MDPDKTVAMVTKEENIPTYPSQKASSYYWLKHLGTEVKSCRHLECYKCKEIKILAFFALAGIKWTKLHSFLQSHQPDLISHFFLLCNHGNKLINHSLQLFSFSSFHHPMLYDHDHFLLFHLHHFFPLLPLPFASVPPFHRCSACYADFWYNQDRWFNWYHEIQSFSWLLHRAFIIVQVKVR